MAQKKNADDVIMCQHGIETEASKKVTERKLQGIFVLPIYSQNINSLAYPKHSINSLAPLLVS
jgi:hypothetical protein